MSVHEVSVISYNVSHEAIASVLLFDEALTTAQWACMCAVVCGTVGMHLAG